MRKILANALEDFSQPEFRHKNLFCYGPIVTTFAALCGTTVFRIRKFKIITNSLWKLVGALVVTKIIAPDKIKIEINKNALRKRAREGENNEIF